MNLNSDGAVSGLRPCHEVPEKLHACPCRRPVCGVNVIPPKIRSEVHDARTSIEALRGKISTVPANFTEIIEGWIAAVRPFVSIGHCRPTVIWEQLNHAASPLSCHPMPAVILLTPTGTNLPGFVVFDRRKPELLLAFSGGEC